MLQNNYSVTLNREAILDFFKSWLFSRQSWHTGLMKILRNGIILSSIKDPNSPFAVKDLIIKEYTLHATGKQLKCYTKFCKFLNAKGT